MSRVIEVHSPHDQTCIGEISVDTPESLDAKVAAASAAMSAWATRSPMARAEALLSIATATRAAFPRLARALSREQGKTLKEALLELDRYVGPFIQYAGLATTTGGRRIGLGGGIEGIVEREPVGVVAAIVPWNFPASLFGTKLAPALAAGCGLLIKPAETTALITIELAAIAKEHLPEGLLDVVVGGSDIASQLVAHPDVARVAFTGSTAVGKQVASAAGAGLKRMSLELGGCDPFVVFPGADLSAAVRALMGTRFYNAGQVCVAPKRLIVHRSVADTMIEMLSARIGRVVVGHGDEATTTMGPLHTSAVRDRLESQVADAVDLGATLIGGGRPDDAGHSGWYAQPGLLVDPPMGSRARQEETFGPILSVIRVGETDEAVRTANETPYGLGASVWSGNNADALAVARQIRSGYTWINTIARVYDELPFGGVKDSGVGREHGAEALDSYLEDHTYVIGAS